VLDVGRKYFAKGDVDNSCPPKIQLISTRTERVISTHVFPADVAPRDGAFLNDLVLDLQNQLAYISSTGNNASDLGAIVVYDRLRDRSRRFEDERTHAATDTAEIRPLVIHGTEQPELLGFPTDGIALAPNLEKLYWSQLGGYHLYSVDTAVLRDFGASQTEISATIFDHGAKLDISDGMNFGSNGDLFYGGLTTDSLYRWTPGTSLSESEVVVKDEEKLWWIDTFAWDGKDNIWLTSNRLNTWFFTGMDFSGDTGSNFRFAKVAVGTNSYMESEPESALCVAHPGCRELTPIDGLCCPVASFIRLACCDQTALV